MTQPDQEASSDSPAPCTVTITRREPEDVQDRWIRVYIDDLPEEILRYGEVLTRQLPAGHHRVKVHNTLSKDAIEFDATPGEHVRLRCHNSIARGGVLTLLIMGFAFIKVRLEREG